MASAGAVVCVAARIKEWKRDFEHAPQCWVICYYSAGHLTRLQANLAGYRP
jgi:hypothetical protein